MFKNSNKKFFFFTIVNLYHRASEHVRQYTLNR